VKPQTLKADNRNAMDSGILGYSRAPSPSSPETPALTDEKPSAFELPPVPEIERHISHFFSNTGLLFPFVHEPSFRETFNTFKTTGKVRRSWLGLLNIVMVSPAWPESTPLSVSLRGGCYF
jgi:hypothetical protein